MSDDLFPIACPVCSIVGKVNLISRPIVVRGRGSGRFFMVGGPRCEHINTTSPKNIDDEAAPLVAKWNAWAEKKAAEVATSRRLSPEQAAAFIAALRSPRS